MTGDFIVQPAGPLNFLNLFVLKIPSHQPFDGHDGIFRVLLHPLHGMFAHYELRLGKREFLLFKSDA